MVGPDAEEPLLTDEETSALLDAMREEESDREAEVVSTDLGSPEGPMREALARADAAAAPIGAAARTQLLIQTARGVDVELLPAEIVPRDVLGSAIDPRALLYELRHRGAPQGLLAIDSSLARYVLERAMGADLAEPTAPPSQGFSDLDRQVIEDFPRAAVRALEEHFLEGRPVTLTPQLGVEDARGGVRFEPMLRVGLRFSSQGTRVGELLFALNAAGVAASSPQAEEEQDRARRQARDHRAALRQTLADVEVELVAVLGRARSSVRQLLELRAGDVFRLDGSPSDPLSMCVGDVTVALGSPLVVSGDLAVEIIEARGRAPKAA